jgi:hypothetical protein
LASQAFRDLSLWYRLRKGDDPELISLTPNRPIREYEYGGVQGVVNQVFVPRLKALLPAQPVRVEDTWSIQRPAAQALMGKLPEAGDIDLEARLARVERAAEGTKLTATIDLSGEVVLGEQEGAVRARILFVFEPPPPGSPGEPKEPDGRAEGTRSARDAGIIEARGYIAKVQMTRRLTTPLEDAPRLRQILTREFELQRRLTGGPAAGPEAALLPIPDPPPRADESNSWILYDDPRGRFHFRHPQDLAIDLHQPDRVEMTYARPDGGLDVLIVLPTERQEDPLRERQLRDPQAFVRELQDAWLRNGHEVVMGEAGFLPDADWAPRKRRVYRIESAIKPKQEALGGRKVPRFYLDAYLILFERNECIRLEALTDRDNHVVLRDQAEGLIRSLELGPSAPGMAVRPAESQPTRPSATPSAPGRPAPPPGPSSAGRS